MTKDDYVVPVQLRIKSVKIAYEFQMLRPVVVADQSCFQNEI